MARPFNDDLPDASLRLDRGSAGFLAACTAWLIETGCPAVHSPPLMQGGLDLWHRAGFVEGRRLVMMERDLRRAPAPPDHPVRRGAAEDWPACAAIDGAAFPIEWRVGHAGLQDAMEATSSSQLLVAEGDGGPAGFAIVGASYQTSYLQRIAVDPAAQGSGVGTSLIRAAIAWGRRSTGRTMLLNTQPDNHRAAQLYRTEGFVSLPQHLHVLRHPATDP